jgi:hypothetical protein
MKDRVKRKRIPAAHSGRHVALIEPEGRAIEIECRVKRRRENGGHTLTQVDVWC